MTRIQTHFLSRVPPELAAVLSAAMDRFQLDPMSINGPGHWLKVFEHATRLAQQTPGADQLVCQLFALLHDCERWDADRLDLPRVGMRVDVRYLSTAAAKAYLRS